MQNQVVGTRERIRKFVDDRMYIVIEADAACDLYTAGASLLRHVGEAPDAGSHRADEAVARLQRALAGVGPLENMLKERYTILTARRGKLIVGALRAVEHDESELGLEMSAPIVLEAFWELRDLAALAPRCGVATTLVAVLCGVQSERVLAACPATVLGYEATGFYADIGFQPTGPDLTLSAERQREVLAIARELGVDVRPGKGVPSGGPLYAAWV